MMQQLCPFRQALLRHSQHEAARVSKGAATTNGIRCRLEIRPSIYHQHATVLQSTACRARLPHMDEEIEHMQWQLDKRSQEGSSDSSRSSNGSSRHGAKAGRGRGQQQQQQQHVFHERHSNRHRRHLQHHQQHHRQAGSSSSSSASESDQDSLPQLAAANAPSAAAASDDSSVPTAEQAAQQQAAQYYHLQLQASAAGADLHKARDRLLKHILQDGGCYVSSSTAQAGALSHLLLFLQQRQVQEQQGSVLLLQPVDCERPVAAVAAVPATGSVGSSSGGGGGSSTVVTPAGQQRQHAGSCSIDELKFWATAVPLEMLLGMLQPPPQQQQQTAEAAGINAAAAEQASSNSSSAVNASSMSLMDGTFPFSMESSTEEWQMPTSSSGGSTARVIVRTSSDSASGAASRRDSSSSSSSSNNGGGDAEAPLIDAAGRSCSATGALLLAALAQQRLKCVRVGSHADANSVAGSVMRAVTRGTVEALHVKGSPAAHAVAYTALELAAGQLLAGQQPQGFGVLLVPGHAHEHVHAVPQGHAAGSSAADAAAAHRAGEQQHHHGSSRVHSDASMAVGGFGAAFYGIGDSSSGRAAEHWLHHRHAQEMWLCVVPLTLAE